MTGWLACRVFSFLGSLVIAESVVKSYSSLTRFLRASGHNVGKSFNLGRQAANSYNVIVNSRFIQNDQTNKMLLASSRGKSLNRCMEFCRFQEIVSRNERRWKCSEKISGTLIIFYKNRFLINYLFHSESIAVTNVPPYTWSDFGFSNWFENFSWNSSIAVPAKILIRDRCLRIFLGVQRDPRK